MIDDAELLRRYAEERADAAFAELVRRNIDLLYATALRLVGDSHRAQDVVQSVFIDVARKARALHRHPALVSWLYTSTRYAALKDLRGEQRRRLREQQACAMQPADEACTDWERIRPLIDEVLGALGERDREIVLLRFFRGLSFAEIAAALRVNDGAARMRVDRALSRMNELLARRGVHSTATAVGVALAAQPGVAAPAALAASTAAAALSGVGTGGAGLLGYFVVMTKLKIAVGVLVLAGAATGIVELRANRALHDEWNALRTVNSAALDQEHRRLSAAVAERAVNDPNVGELAKLRDRIAVLKARPAGVTDATLHAPRNLGRATPAEAAETFCWAVSQRDLDRVASFVRLKDDTPANREAFMAGVSAAVQARYRTPERLCAAALFGATIVPRGAMPDELDRMQVIGVEPRNGPGDVRITLWMHSVTGREIRGGDSYTLGPDGWGVRPMSLTNPDILRAVQERIDPLTGDFRPPTLKPEPRT